MSWDWSKEDSDVVAVVNAAGETNRYYIVSGELMLIREGEKNLKSSIHHDLNTLKFNVGNDCYIRPEQPEWSIYNNDLPFGELTDEQKGKLMVASLSCAICTSVNGDLKSVEKPSWHKDVTYRAKQPEPSMVDKFIADVPAGLDWREVELAALHMINEGWVKS